MEDLTPRSDPSHVIRLRGPWRYQAIDPPGGTADGPGDPLPSAPCGVCEVPTTWRDGLPPLLAGRVQLERNFGRPTGLETGDTVTLAILGFDGVGRLVLNGAPLKTTAESGQRFAADITSILLPRNTLAIEIFVEPPPSNGRIGEARIEIFSRG